MESVKADYQNDVVSAGQLLRILDTDAREVSALCQKARLKPKKDGFGNIYFSKDDVDVLRKVKELYAISKRLQDGKKIEPAEPKMQIPPAQPQILQKENKLMKKQKTMPEFIPGVLKIEPMQVQSPVLNRIDDLENNVVSRITDVLAEKLDGLDEVIVELVKAKTENETLRQKVNELNKENFALKTETSSYKPVGLGLYIKKSRDEFSF